MAKLIFNQNKEKLKDGLGQVDAICVDLDQCLFISFVQIFVALGVSWESIISPWYWRFLPQLFCGGLFLTGLCIKYVILGKDINNQTLMDRYERAISGIPIALIKKHTEYINRFFSPYSVKFLESFSRKGVKVFVLSLCIQPIMDVIEKNIGFKAKCFGNEVLIDAKQSTFKRYAENRMCSGNDKLERLKKIMQDCGLKKWLIIWHSQNETPLIRHCLSLGGISLGINPSAELEKEFALILRGLRWRKLLDLSKEIER